MIEPTAQQIDDFISRWQTSGAAERANFPQFAVELCDLIGVPRPEPTTAVEAHNRYVFEKAVPLPHGTVGRIDLYKRGCFVLEAKQGSEQKEETTTFSEAALRQQQRRKRGTAVRGTAGWDTAMEKAKQQAQRYARNLPTGEIQDGRPPLLITVDVGNTIALYREFSRTGGNYIPFPDPHSYRLEMADLHEANVRQLLRQVWTDPMSLDPSRRSARVTRQIAARLAQLAKSLEEAGHDPQTAAQFLMRCLFTMFAEDVGLLPERSFAHLLGDMKRDVQSFQPMLEHLWDTMNKGGFSVILRHQIPQFNGGLFATPTAIPLTADQLQLLAEAAQADWRDVEPAIFGTLLERALDPIDRHKLGAHYTPRAYVERLVEPTVIAPLRAEWEAVQTAVALQNESGQTSQAINDIKTFQRRLASIRILDPACGSGNFLYVTLEHLKRLEGEVLNTLRDLGEAQMLLEMESVTVSPQQFLGIEVNPRAAAIAELVLWIGYIQWHIRTTGDVPHAEPIIKDYHNIECRDAVLAWDSVEPLLDEQGQPVTRWDGRSTKKHPVTGQDIPDESARIPAYQYINPRPADWPAADFIVGNPPFIGTARMREALGDGYTEAIRRTVKAVPESADYVMYWWHKAAELTRAGKLTRFGLITTNSLRQTFNRRVLQQHMEANNPLSLRFAIPDHPWVDSADGAAVRIAMTVAQAGEHDGLLRVVTYEKDTETDEAEVIFSERRGKIQADLTIGAKVASAKPLISNIGLATMGVKLNGSGFLLEMEQAKKLGFGSDATVDPYIRPFVNGRDLVQRSREVLVIDLFGLTVDEARLKVPSLYQWVFEYVKPQRDATREERVREQWWLHGRSRPEFRNAIADLSRYTATCRTAKHRTFIFLSSETLPESKVVAIAHDDAFYLGVLSSKIHGIWALAKGGFLGVGNDPTYNHTDCFDTFPFPDTNDEQKATIRHLAEQLDAHRQRQLAQHPQLTMTDIYNVLEKLRAAQVTGTSEVPVTLSPKERQIHEWGLVSILQQLHDDLDTAVAAAYGWPANLPDEDILQRLVDLNAQRAAEEANGHIRWLRPEYQAPEAAQPTQAALLEMEEEETAVSTPVSKQTWPSTITEQVQSIRAALAAFTAPVTAEDIAGLYGRRTATRIQQIGDLLETLTMLGHAQGDGGRYTAV